MIRAATPKGILETVGWLISSLLIGALAGRIAKYFGAPMELRILAFVALTGMTMAIWHVGRIRSEAGRRSKSSDCTRRRRDACAARHPPP